LQHGGHQCLSRLDIQGAKWVPLSRKTGNAKSHEMFTSLLATSNRSVPSASFLSEGNFPICHWRLLVTKLKKAEMFRRIQNMETTVCGCSGMKPWGTLSELLHDAHNKITHNVVYDFLGEEWYLEWKHITVAFIGQTYVSEEMLTKEGEIYINGIILTNHKRQKL
jgi:hypothetical protein